MEWMNSIQVRVEITDLNRKEFGSSVADLNAFERKT